MSTIETEKAILDAILPKLAAEGYEVFRQPPQHLLPGFMAQYQPDAIAIGNGKKIAIEIVTARPKAALKLDELRRRFSADSGWELRIVYACSQPDTAPLDLASTEAIEQSLATVERLVEADLTQAALLIAWATLEALGRRLMPTHLNRPQTPGRLVEVLAHEGELTPDEADIARQLINLRNRLIHGDLDVRVTAPDLTRFLAILRALLALASKETAAG